jgi:hypothetical protein
MEITHLPDSLALFAVPADPTVARGAKRSGVVDVIASALRLWGDVMNLNKVRTLAYHALEVRSTFRFQLHRFGKRHFGLSILITA